MKKLIILTAILIIGSCIFAQNQSSDHLMFKGVPIDGTLNEFVAKMKQSGFGLLKQEEGVTLLKGDFAGYKDCIIRVSTLQDKDLVSKISVIFPTQETWPALSSDYFSLKEMLKQKYSEPSVCTEKFQSSNEPQDDRQKIFEVKTERCIYNATFKTEKGSIQLVMAQSRMECFVMLTYFDKTNGEIVKSKAIDDL